MKKSQINKNQNQKVKITNGFSQISQQILAEIKSSFDLFDTDHSGYIDTKCIFILEKELKQAMIALGFESRNSSIFRMISDLDSDGNDVITFQEWIHLMTTKSTQIQDKKHYQKVFKLFDNENYGYICCNRLVEVAKQLGQEITYEQVVEMLKRADVDSDGLISFEEFYTIMTKNINEPIMN